MAKHFEKPDGPDNPEKVENPEKSGKTEGKEKESFLDKAKNFFAEHTKPKEGKESDGKKEEASDKGTDKMEERRQAFLDSLKVGVEKGKDSEVAKEYREKHGLDEHGEKIDKNGEKPEKKAETSDDGDNDTHGEDGERTRYSDKRYAETHEDKNREDDDFDR